VRAPRALLRQQAPRRGRPGGLLKGSCTSSAPARRVVEQALHQGTHLLHIAPGLPVAADAVPLLGCGDDDVGREESPEVGRVVACKEGEGVSEEGGASEPQLHLEAQVLRHAGGHEGRPFEPGQPAVGTTPKQSHTSPTQV